nr:hypothetical protein [Tanacetum cinerariifolium]
MARGPLEQNGSKKTRKMREVLWIEIRQDWLHMVTLKKRELIMMREEEKKDAEGLGNEDNEVLNTEEPRVNQEKDSVNSTNRVNAVSSTINVVSNKVNVVGTKSSIKLLDDPNIHDLKDFSIFKDSIEDVFGAK